MACTLVEEGVVIPPTLVVRRGEPHFEDVLSLLTAPPWPTRALAFNLADIAAGLAACRHGADGLGELARRHGTRSVTEWMARLEEHAERHLRLALGRLEPGRREAHGVLDDGSRLRAAITIAGPGALIDLRGSAPVHPGNLNATEAVVRAVVLYVLRLLAGEELPLNDGLLKAVEVRVEPGILDPPFGDDPARSPAVVGGNVETSQRLVDTLLDALGLVACSQGTMNNVLFGNDRGSHYETIGGGTGAGPGFAGASGVHSHMTNTRITDVEVLETRHRVRIERFSLRRASGGRGRFAGGDGLHRAYRFLDRFQLSILSQHRRSGPYGKAGGEPGRPGRQWIERASTGERVELAAIDGCEVGPGDLLVVETPGGGGWGAAEPDRAAAPAREP
jgi:5-oxoprolinase (ATP-hydrolysing)